MPGCFVWSRGSTKKARDQSPVLPIGERLDSTLKFVQRSRARIEKIQADFTREQHLPGCETKQSTVSPIPLPTARPPVPMDIENPVEEVRRLRACRVAARAEHRGKRRTKVVPRRHALCQFQLQHWMWGRFMVWLEDPVLQSRTCHAVCAMGSPRTALKMAMQEIFHGTEANSELRVSREWKLFFCCRVPDRGIPGGQVGHHCSGDSSHTFGPSEAWSRY